MTWHAATVTTGDGYPLAVNACLPGDGHGGTLLVAPATGVPARYYADFAAWLASRGWTTVTWDWRGIGASAPDSLRGFEASMLDWGEQDFPAIIDWAAAEFPGRLVGLGHSFGGQAFGLADRADAFDLLVLFASGHAYWRLWPRPQRYVFRAAIGAMLLATRAAGYLPGRKLGLGADLPCGVAKQWLNWCLQTDYFGRWQGHARLQAPVLSYGFSDDGYAPLESRRALLQKYGGRPRLVTRTPAEFGLDRVGHLSFFRAHHETKLWPDLLALMKQH